MNKYDYYISDNATVPFVCVYEADEDGTQISVFREYPHTDTGIDAAIEDCARLNFV